MPRGYCKGNDILAGSIFKQDNSTETGLVFDGIDEIAKHNKNDDDGSPFGVNMLSYLLNMLATGG